MNLRRIGRALSTGFRITFLTLFWTVIVVFSAAMCWGAYKIGQQSAALSLWQFCGALTQDAFVSIWFCRPRRLNGSFDFLRLDVPRRCGWVARVMGVIGPAYSAYSFVDLLIRIPQTDFSIHPYMTVPAVSVGLMLSVVDFLTAWQVWTIILRTERDSALAVAH
jgi:hypothetical protein